MQAITAKAGEDLAVERDMTIAKYLYTQQMSDQGYKSLGYPAEFNTEDREKVANMPDDVKDRLRQQMDSPMMKGFTIASTCLEKTSS